MVSAPKAPRPPILFRCQLLPRFSKRLNSKGTGGGGWGEGREGERAGERKRDLSFFTLSFLKASFFPLPLSFYPPRSNSNEQT